MVIFLAVWGACEEICHVTKDGGGSRHDGLMWQNYKRNFLVYIWFIMRYKLVMQKLNRKNTIAKWLKQVWYISMSQVWISSTTLLMIFSLKYDFLLKKVKNNGIGSWTMVMTIDKGLFTTGSHIDLWNNIQLCDIYYLFGLLY